MSGLIASGDPPVTKCAYCSRDAVGPCATCRRSVCGDCCELTEGGANTFAICIKCVKQGGTSMRREWLQLLAWIAAIILGLFGLGMVFALLK